MLYLAKVCRHGETGEASLQILARQKSEHFWILSSKDDAYVVTPQAESFNDDVLVLVEMNSSRQVAHIEGATDWVLGLINTYLATGITPEVLHQEAARIEEWRKDLTLQNQDVARRALELETRRDQIQELEKKLELERKQLEDLMAQANHDVDAQRNSSLSGAHNPPSDAAQNEQEVSP